MNHGLMNGMLWAGMLLASVPILLGIGIGAFLLRRYWSDRTRRTSAAPRS